jgi:hypothetical protein
MTIEPGDTISFLLDATGREVPNRLSDPLLGKMWKTKSSRFNAQVRLSAKHSLSIISTAILAFYLFAASLVDLLHQSSASGSPRVLSVLTVIISVFLIIISLLESTKNHQREADRMHQCALEISELYNRFQALPMERANEERVRYSGLYSEILKKFEINHKDIDYMRFQIAFAKDLKIDGFSVFALYTKYVFYWWAEYALYIVLIIAPPVLFFLYRYQLGW